MPPTRLEYRSSPSNDRRASLFGVICGAVGWAGIVTMMALARGPSNSPGDFSSRELTDAGLAITVFIATVMGAIESAHGLLKRKTPRWKPALGLALNLLPWLVLAFLVIW